MEAKIVEPILIDAPLAKRLSHYAGMAELSLNTFCEEILQAWVTKTDTSLGLPSDPYSIIAQVELHPYTCEVCMRRISHAGTCADCTAAIQAELSAFVKETTR